MDRKGSIYGIVWTWSMAIMLASTQPIIRGETELTRVNVVICVIGLGFGVWSQMKVMK